MAGQVSAVLAGGEDLLDDVGLVRPEPDGIALASQKEGKGRSPTASAKNGYCLDGIYSFSTCAATERRKSRDGFSSASKSFHLHSMDMRSL